MLTQRGWRFLLFVTGILAFGVLAPLVQRQLPIGPPFGLSPYVLADPKPVALVGLTLGLWFVFEWLSFRLRVLSLSRWLRVERELSDERGPADSLWVGRPFQVRTMVRNSGRLAVPFVALEDHGTLPTEPAEGARFEGALPAGGEVELRYAVRPSAPGRARWDGVRVRVADLQGFFQHTAFVRALTAGRILPPLVDVSGHMTTVKRHNLMPPPGQHRHRRPGSGSELLELRDYLPGDPPKTIAWKVSARRGRLITKQFESEVPVRCTLFVDASNSVRVGPSGRNALGGLAGIASAVAQACAGKRDFTGLCLFDEKGAHSVRPGRGPRHLAHVLNLLADAAGLAPTSGQAPVETTVPRAYALARQVYPELLAPAVNRVPFWLPWLAPPPAYVKRQPGWLDRLYRGLPFLLPVYWFLGLGVVAILWLAVSAFINTVQGLDVGSIRLRLLLILLSGFALTLAYLRVPQALFFPLRRRLYAWRKPVSAILSVRYGLRPGGLELLLEDDDRFGDYAQRFLAEHLVPCPLPLYDRRGHYLFASVGKVGVLGDALVQAVGKGRDNELFVLLVDLLELSDELDPLLRAVKVALGRHHRVLVVCAWPPDLPPPADVPGVAPPAAVGAGADALKAALRGTTAARFQDAYRRLRRTFGRLGVRVIVAGRDDAPRLILERLELMRVQGVRR